MLPEIEGETPDVEDQNSNADDDKSETRHQEPADDEGDGLDGEGDEGGGAEDDLQDDDAGTDDGQEDRPAEVSRQSRGSRQFGELRQRARQAEQERDEFRRRLETIEQNSRRVDPAAAAAERKARLELMTPEERTDFLLQEQGQRFEREIGQLRFEQADRGDKLAFDGLCARNPHLARVAERVEEELTKMRRNGGSAPREAIAYYLLGKAASERAAQNGAKQRKKGEENIRRQTAKPAGRGSNVEREDSRGSGNGRAARAKRLENINL